MTPTNQLQWQLLKDFAKLIQKIESLGYAATEGEGWRTPQQAQWNADHGLGIACSLHIERLAVDVNVFVDGIYQTDDRSGCYTALGAFWKSLGSDHYWGGDFKKVDLDHFSISPDGGHTR